MSAPQKLMSQWDAYRKLIAEGSKASLPRDWFESVLDNHEEKITELTLKLAEQQAWIRSVVNELLAPLSHYPDIEIDYVTLSRIADGFGQLSVGLCDEELTNEPTNRGELK